jgi:GTP-binding protein
VKPYLISGVSGEGVQAVLRRAAAKVREARGWAPVEDEDTDEPETPGGWAPS